LSRKIKDFSSYLSAFVSDDHLEKVAKETGFKRRSSIITPKAFLNTLFFSNLKSSPSLSEYSIDLEYQSDKRVTKQAIDKRFNERTKLMLTKLLEKILASQIKRKLPLVSNHFSEIRIMDSSDFVLSRNLADTFPGYGGPGREAIAQVQLEYELLGGKVTRLSLGSALDADAKAGMERLDEIPPKALLIRDLGYSSPKAFKELIRRDLYFVSRAKSHWLMYYKEDGVMKELTIYDIKDRLNNSKEKYIDLDVFVGKKILTPVRLIANLLSEEQTLKRIKKKKAKRGTLSQLALDSACLNLFVTNIEREKCDASKVYQLYTLRWQIELIFKVWKSMMSMHKLHPMNGIRLECVMLIKFIWVMINWSLLKLTEEVVGVEMSLHKMVRTLTGRAFLLNMSILEDVDKLTNWIKELIKISGRHHIKEYKKGSNKYKDILANNG
jgi:hypothetical protein